MEKSFSTAPLIFALYKIDHINSIIAFLCRGKKFYKYLQEHLLIWLESNINDLCVRFSTSLLEKLLTRKCREIVLVVYKIYLANKCLNSHL